MGQYEDTTSILFNRNPYNPTVEQKKEEDSKQKQQQTEQEIKGIEDFDG